MGYKVTVGSVKIEMDTIQELVQLLDRLQLDLKIGVDAGCRLNTDKRRETLPSLLQSLPPRTKEFLRVLAGSPSGIERSSVAQHLGLDLQGVSRLVAGLSRRVRCAGYRLDDVMISKRIRWLGGRTYLYTPSDALLAEMGHGG